MALFISYAVFQSFWNKEIFVKLNLPIFLVLVKLQEKLQKYCDLSALTKI